MRRVIVESPYGSKDDAIVAENEQYARACMADCLDRGEAPFLSHLLYTQVGVLNDRRPDERRRGMEAGWAWRSAADAVVVYLDRGVSSGMQEAIKGAEVEGKPLERRWLYRKNWRSE